MVSFNLPIGKEEGSLNSAVILKFELLYAPIPKGYDLQASFDAVPAAVHEFRIPPKALLGLHSYCPVHFDAFHSVLVDLSMHIVYLKAGANASSEKVPSSDIVEAENQHSGQNMQVFGQVATSKAIELVKSLLSSRMILLEELQKMSKDIGQTVNDINDADLHLGKFESIASSSSSIATSGIPQSNMGVGQLVGMLQNILEKSNGSEESGIDAMLYSLSKAELLEAFFKVGNQLSFLWNVFLKFHRVNRVSILDHLHGAWASDRKTEWSIWMVQSNVDVSQLSLKSAVDDVLSQSAQGKIVPRRSNDDPAQTAFTRAELHRRSIAQMKINSRSIQDMHIFGDPSHVPVVLVEQHVQDSSAQDIEKYMSLQLADQNGMAATLAPSEEKTVPKLNLTSKRNGHILKVVVFVHGFQGHHLDLRLVRNQWLLIDPGAECLMSETNEEKTSGDFREMGSRLAEEVIAFIKRKVDKLSRYGGCKDIKLSFVGHSIGNIIIRSALSVSVMTPFFKYLYTYMSLSGPHLGYWYSSNSLFNSGLWLLKKLKGTQCIHQLTCSDDPDPQNTFFYKLCKQKTLEGFKNIVLFSSPQDGYVPYHSARIESCPAASSDTSKKAQAFTEMVNNCLDQIRAPSSGRRVFMRCDVNFDTSTQGRNFNTFIGRAAHIEFLEIDSFMKFVMWSYPEFFR